MGRYARVQLAGSVSYAELHADRAELLSAAPWCGGVASGQSVALSEVSLLCPVTPSKILGIGRNYRAHAAELGHEVPQEPLVFLKAPSALLDPGGALVLPPESERVDYEGELGVVIGKRARHVSEAEALDHVFGYCCVCDVTARDLQKKDGQWARAKGFDTFCPVGDSVVSGLDPAALDLKLEQNGVLRQDGNTRDMIFSVPQLVAYLSRAMTLEPGDLIATGTPEGVGPLSAGDRVALTIAGIGRLEFSVQLAR